MGAAAILHIAICDIALLASLPGSYSWRDGLADVGAAVSIVGLVITFLVMRRIDRIHREFLFNARLPRIRKDILTQRKNLEIAIQDSNTRAAGSCIMCLRASLENVIPKLAKKDREPFECVLTTLPRRVDNVDSELTSLHSLISEMDGLALRLTNIELDSKWSLRDGS